MHVQRPEGWEPTTREWKSFRPRPKRTGVPGWPANPELEPSLRLLLEEQRYSITDVGMMFGISRERVRQWAVKFGIQQNGYHRHNHSRVWDDERNTFRPVLAPEYHATMKAIPRQRKRQERIARHEAARARIVAVLKACAERLGRTPTVIEAWEAVSGTHRDTWPVSLHQGYAAGMLTGLWVGGQRRSRKGVMAQIWTATGLQPRPVGGRGHLGPRKKKNRT